MTASNLTRRAVLAAPAFLAAPALLAAAARPSQAAGIALTAQDRADIARIEIYMNGLRSLKARFLQVAPDGRTSQGTAWIDRPGRLRFEYDPPSPFLLVAGHGLVVFHDKKLMQTNNFPLSQTPLSTLLSDTLKLSGDVTVIGIDRQPGLIQVATMRTSSPGDGSLTLVFADAPLALRQWAVVDCAAPGDTGVAVQYRAGRAFRRQAVRVRRSAPAWQQPRHRLEPLSRPRRLQPPRCGVAPTCLHFDAIIEDAAYDREMIELSR